MRHVLRSVPIRFSSPGSGVLPRRRRWGAGWGVAPPAAALRCLAITFSWHHSGVELPDPHFFKQWDFYGKRPIYKTVLFYAMCVEMLFVLLFWNRWFNLWPGFARIMNRAAGSRTGFGWVLPEIRLRYFLASCEAFGYFHDLTTEFGSLFYSWEGILMATQIIGWNLKTNPKPLG